MRLDRRGAALFGCACAERTLLLWRLCPDLSVADRVRTTLDHAWEVLKANDSDRPLPGSEVDSLLDCLHEDADFGPHHSVLIPALAAAAHAASAVANLTDEPSARSQAVETAKAVLLVVETAFYVQNGSYRGSKQHGSVVREQRWQQRDMADACAVDAEVIEAVRLRARRNSQLVLDGVENGAWGSSWPEESWPTLFGDGS